MSWLALRGVNSRRDSAAAEAGTAVATKSRGPQEARVEASTRRPRKRADGELSSSQRGIVPEPIRDRNRFGPLAHMDALTMATALRDLVADAGYPPGTMLNFTEISKIYREMCIQNHWRERSWHSVGRVFDRLTTGGKKPYAYFADDNGRSQRLRIYPLPTEQQQQPSLRVA